MSEDRLVSSLNESESVKKKWKEFWWCKNRKDQKDCNTLRDKKIKGDWKSLLELEKSFLNWKSIMIMMILNEKE